MQQNFDFQNDPPVNNMLDTSYQQSQGQQSFIHQQASFIDNQQIYNENDTSAFQDRSIVMYEDSPVAVEAVDDVDNVLHRNQEDTYNAD